MRFGYVDSDATTIDYPRGRRDAPPAGAAFDRPAPAWWNTMAIEPVVTWGIDPGMSVGASQRIRRPTPSPSGRAFREALAHMGFEPKQPIKVAKIDVAFAGSCTNARLPNLRVPPRWWTKGKGAKWPGCSRPLSWRGLDSVRPMVSFAGA